MSERRWCFMDLVTDKTTGRLRESAISSIAGKSTLTWAVIYTTLHTGLTEWLVFAYGAIVIGHESISRVLNQRQQTLEHNQEKKS